MRAGQKDGRLKKFASQLFKSLSASQVFQNNIFLRHRNYLLKKESVIRKNKVRRKIFEIKLSALIKTRVTKGQRQKKTASKQIN